MTDTSQNDNWWLTFKLDLECPSQKIRAGSREPIGSKNLKSGVIWSLVVGGCWIIMSVLVLLVMVWGLKVYSFSYEKFPGHGWMLDCNLDKMLYLISLFSLCCAGGRDDKNVHSYNYECYLFSAVRQQM